MAKLFLITGVSSGFGRALGEVALRKRRMKYSNQLGDPQKVARAMPKHAASDSLRAHLLLGSDAVWLVGEKMNALQSKFAAWMGLSLSTDTTECLEPTHEPIRRRQVRQL